MTIYENPNEKCIKTIFQRPSQEDDRIKDRVKDILEIVRRGRDKSMFSLISEIDKYEVSSETIMVSEDEIYQAEMSLSDEFKDAISVAKANISKFHSAQLSSDISLETTAGVQLFRKRVPISRVGLYIPSGTAPLFSTVLMCAVPASIAGCKEIIITTPAGPDGKVAPEILYTAKVCGVKNIYKVGGAIAIAAMAYGTESIPKVDKIFGPGNRYVTYAKQFVSTDNVAIDMPAGPSEVMVLGDESARADFVASDLLSQLEHGSDSQAIAIVSTKEIALEVEKEVLNQISALDRQDILKQSLSNCHIIVESDINRMLDMANQYAAEHLIISLKDVSTAIEKIVNAGSVFIGNYSPESAGDYASGTNHTLPTSGWANSYSGVSLDTFCKFITYQNISYEGLKNLSSTIITMAEHEGLPAHKNAVKIRLIEESK